MTELLHMHTYTPHVVFGVVSCMPMPMLASAVGSQRSLQSARLIWAHIRLLTIAFDFRPSKAKRNICGARLHEHVSVITGRAARGNRASGDRAREDAEGTAWRQGRTRVGAVGYVWRLVQSMVTTAVLLCAGLLYMYVSGGLKKTFFILFC